MPREAGRIAAEMPVPKLAAVAKSHAFNAEMVLNVHFMWKVYSKLLGFPVFTEMPLATSGQDDKNINAAIEILYRSHQDLP